VAKALNASSLIRQLQAILSTHGDLPVVLRDPGTDWLLNVALKVNETSHADAASWQRIELLVRYDDSPYTRHAVGVHRACESNEGPGSHDVTEAAAATPHHLQSEDD
jgi:hypothetical protein